MMLVFSPKVYRYLVKEGWLPKPTEAEKKSIQKHNKELAQRLSEAVNPEVLSGYATTPPKPLKKWR